MLITCLWDSKGVGGMETEPSDSPHNYIINY